MSSAHSPQVKVRVNGRVMAANFLVNDQHQWASSVQVCKLERLREHSRQRKADPNWLKLELVSHHQLTSGSRLLAVDETMKLLHQNNRFSQMTDVTNYSCILAVAAHDFHMYAQGSHEWIIFTQCPCLCKLAGRDKVVAKENCCSDGTERHLRYRLLPPPSLVVIPTCPPVRL